MQKFGIRHKFTFGNSVLGVVERVVDSDAGVYHCVYHQNNLKIVKDTFFFDGENWTPKGDGRRLLGPEAAPFEPVLGIK